MPDRSAPDRSETRILSAAADQLGQVVRRDRLAAEATAAEVARQSDRLKTALLDSVSHDLRTPLATIRASAGSLLDPEIQWSADEQRAALRSIDAEAERLNLLVRNLLDLSRIEGGALHPELEPHDLDEIVGGTVARLRPRDKTLTVRVAPTLPPVLVDDLYLDEILTNLVENAVRHGGSTIVVRAAVVADAPFVELVVEDDGPGAPDAALPRLFDKFFRVDQARGTSRRGMGVGLTVVQGLARAMDGDVAARRSDLGGLAVAVRLPVAPAGGSHRPGLGRASPVSPGGVALLLVEDDAPTRRAVAAYLEKHGYRIDEAADAREALRAWEAHRADLVLLDLGLPDLDGVEVVRRIRREATTPIVILSARGEERDKVAALEAGADDYLTKPFGTEELHARIRAVLRRAAGPAADASGLLVLGPVSLDIGRREVRVGIVPSS